MITKVKNITKYQSILTIAAVSFAYYLPDHQQYLLIFLCAFLILGFGLPHGALDHVLFKAAYRNLSKQGVNKDITAQSNTETSPVVIKTYFNVGAEGTIEPSVVFYCNYLFMMSAWAFSWYHYPFTSFWAFIGVSCWHFGEVNRRASQIILGWLGVYKWNISKL